MKRRLFIIIPAVIIGIPVLCVVLFFLFLTIVEYRPKPIEDVPYTTGNEMLVRGKPVSIMSWNIGYAGLGKDEDFFMDGGKIAEQGTPEEIFTNPKNPRTKEFLSKVL